MRRLFEPLRLGALELPNRLVMPALHVHYTPDGHIGERMLAFYAARAKGGVGLIQIGGCPITPHAGSSFMIGIHDDAFLPGLRRFADTIHAYGAKTGVQLYHAGRYTPSFFLGGESAPSASATLSPLTKETAHAMSLAEIDAAIRAYAEGAARAVRAGFDVVEIIASAGYLINQFHSPLTNTRTDAYGGSPEKRMRFGLEVVRAVKDAVGETPVSLRFSGNDFVPGSNGLDENTAFACDLAREGVAFFNVTGGWHESPIPQIANSLPEGGYAYLARHIRRATGVPVAAANRLLTPDRAERLLAEGWADLVSLGRALIADPEWPNKARAGEAARILHCVSCNQECLEHAFALEPVACLVNPRAGAEGECVPLAAVRKRVLVIGGGPAGLVAAEAAARRGHEVTLWEARERVGGQLWAAARAPGKDAFATLPVDLERAAREAGVAICTSQRATEGAIAAFAPEAVILANGSEPVRLELPGFDLPHVVSPLDWLEGRVEPRGPVVVIGGGAIGIEAALVAASVGTIDAEQAAFLLRYEAESPERIRRLLEQGSLSVTVVELTKRLGSGIGRSTRWIHVQELTRRGVEILTETRVRAYDGARLTLQTPLGETTREAALVIVAVGMRADYTFDSLAERLGVPVIRVGDAARLGNAADAVRDAWHAALTL